MNNPEAADLLSKNKSVFQHDPEMLEALDMAIVALSIIGADEEYFPGRRAYFNGYADGAKRAIQKEKCKVDQTQNIVHLMLEITSKIRYLDNGEDRSSEGRTNTYLSQIMVLLGDITISMARIADSLTVKDLKQEQD